IATMHCGSSGLTWLCGQVLISRPVLERLVSVRPSVAGLAGLVFSPYVNVNVDSFLKPPLRACFSVVCPVPLGTGTAERLVLVVTFHSSRPRARPRPGLPHLAALQSAPA